MTIVVHKYGGSSVADVDRIKRVAARVVNARRDGKQVCVVVSAMGKTTDQLLGLAHQIADAPSRRELDMLLTAGERITMALLSMAIQELGFEAISFTGSQAGVMTNDRHSGARIIEVRPVRVQDELERGRVVIVAGFQGVSYKREITTLGRGGSDTTAVALAAALGAEYCEICSDVDGVYTADPRVVDGAELLETISCDAMEELAAHGAQVLHPAAVEFARAAGIALYARATSRDGGGTRIGQLADCAQRSIAGITGQRNLVCLTLVRDAARQQLLAALESVGVAVQQLTGDSARARAALCLADIPDWVDARTQLAVRFGDALDIAEVGAVSVVGEGLASDPTWLTRAMAAAAGAGIEVTDVASSPLRITLTCQRSEVDELIRALHTTLVEA